MEDNQKVFFAALAGLLHDVGKFAQRAGVLAPAGKDDTNDRTVLSRKFIAEYVPEQWRVATLDEFDHRRPEIEPNQTCMELAGQLSAGGPADTLDGKDEIQPPQLLSIFCSVVSEKMTTEVDMFLPVVPLELDVETERSSFFPGEADADAAIKASKALWGDFIQQATALRDAHQGDGNLAVYLESLQLLLQRYTWCLPAASYQGRSDISLYDQSRMQAALAAIFAGSQTDDQPDTPPQETGASQSLALLVGGDVSGVQEFIYTITARGATSALRGRSFYLQLLTEVIARYILYQLKLPLTNLIYAGGGNFYLLTRPSDANRLVELQRNISRILLYHHRGDLYVALASLPLSKKDFYGAAISTAWENLINQLQHNKLRRFSELGDDLKILFKPQGHGGNDEKHCHVCGNEHPGTEEDKHGRRAEDERGPRKCPPCFSYEALGDQVRDAEYLILQMMEPDSLPVLSSQPTPGKWEQVIEGTTVGYKVIRKFPVVKASAVRVTISKSKACPVISNVELYKATEE